MQISNLFWGIVLIEFLTELSVFSVLKMRYAFSESVNEFQYLRQYVFTPSFINLVSVFFSSVFQHSKNRTTDQKNDAVLFTGIVMCFVITYFHDTVFIVYAIYVIPIMVTILFGESKKTRIVFFSSMFFSSVNWLRSFIHIGGALELFFINLTAFYAVLLAAYLICQVLISYNKENLIYLKSGHRLQESLREQVKQDPLTGLYNQNTFFSYIETVLNEDTPKGKATTLAIMDLDDFKKINDTYGHSTGNEVLTSLSKMLRIFFSEENEFTSRYGGEEFAILFRETTKETAAEKIDYFRKEFSRLSFSSMNNENVTFSVGVAQSNFLRDSPDDLFDRADNALYQAKALGKDRTIVFT
ncbi:GGDEF domain-containing protein [Sinanaerobacter sp. ZZT-01]|uniref:GGDEF domain-containing protein n=1 Tax=Sinanaerobacter sp. ZZT-01 TaxID=3111540 RepID=UPI002D7934A2|nr:GGDEF domain-containing protein [Sinanaerobacter sp. ZZT-01]WRR93611.1 GGDEF domain-containing protein [Sinanaerobacter sp. ZZT-01]